MVADVAQRVKALSYWSEGWKNLQLDWNPKLNLYSVAFFSRKPMANEWNHGLGNHKLLAAWKVASLAGWRQASISNIYRHKNLVPQKTAKWLNPDQACLKLFFVLTFQIIVMDRTQDQLSVLSLSSYLSWAGPWTHPTSLLFPKINHMVTLIQRLDETVMSHYISVAFPSSKKTLIKINLHFYYYI